MVKENVEIYRRLLRLRIVEEKIAQIYAQQQIRCPVHLCLGQEAIPVGAVADLTSDDVLLCSHRSHGPYVGSGGDIYAMLAELFGKAEGCCGGKGGSMHLTNVMNGFWGAIPIVGSALPIATGAALAFKMRGKQQVSMVIFGDGATEEGVFHESLQYAALKNLPVIYVCENNGFSVNTPLSERRCAKVKLPGLAKAHGVFSSSGDGNNVFVVQNTCGAAIRRAREGGGPSFLEFKTYRWIEHCGPDDDHHLPCRSRAALRHWRKRCPLAVAEKALLARDEVCPQDLLAIRNEEMRSVEAALARAQAAPFPAQSAATSGVYAPGEEKSCAN